MSNLTAVRSAPTAGSTVPQQTTAARSPRAATRRAARQDRRVRVTARGRAALLLVMVVLLLAAFAVGRSASSQATSESPAAAPAAEQITVQPGDTLWSLAERIAPARDPREVVSQIRRLNGLPTAALQAGQQLLVPAVV